MNFHGLLLSIIVFGAIGMALYLFAGPISNFGKSLAFLIDKEKRENRARKLKSTYKVSGLILMSFSFLMFLLMIMFVVLKKI